MILETGNYAYLVYGWDEYRRAFQDNEKCRDLWNDIYTEYCLIAEDNTSIFYYETYKEVIYLETRFETVSKILLLMCESDYHEDKNVMLLYKEALNQWEYDINLDRDFEKEVERLAKNLRFSMNKIQLKRHELEELRGEEEEKRTFTREVVEMEMAMNRDFIDPKTTSVLKWREMIDALKEKNRRLKRV